MKAEIVSVGTEILLGDILDTNSRYLSRRLAELGVEVYYHTSVGDNPQRLAEVLKRSFDRSDMIITTGGLGPTVDDITRETAAQVLELPLEFSETAWASIKSFFDERGVVPSDNNRRQAMIIAGAAILDNRVGTAPGQWVIKNGKHLILLPGPPGEMTQMFENSVAPRLKSFDAPQVIKSRVLRVCGLGESVVEERLRDLMNASNPTLAPYAKPGEVHLRITAKAGNVEEAMKMIAPMEWEVTTRLGDLVFGKDDETLEEAVGRELVSQGFTLAVAESCSGGLLASRITDIPGSSGYFLGGIIAYSVDVKACELGVSRDIIDAYGVCSAQVANAMAEGVKTRLGASIGIGITGIAGPDGGSKEAPVGTVYMSVASPWGTRSQKGLFRGTRTEIKWRATQTVLTMLWNVLKENKGEAKKKQ